MKSAKALSVGLATLAAIAAFSPTTQAHNPAKYANIPFVVAAACASAGTSSIISSGGQPKIVLNSTGDGFVGFEVYCSNPGTGTLPSPTSGGTFPQGVITFNISGLQSGTDTVAYAQAYTNSTTTGTFATPVNGLVTLNVNQAGLSSAQVYYVQVYFDTQPNSQVTISNLKLNNSPLLVDTTFTDSSDTAFGSYCFDGP